MFWLLGMSIGVAFGEGLSVALNNILILPIAMAAGMLTGAIVGMIYIKINHHDRND